MSFSRSLSEDSLSLLTEPESRRSLALTIAQRLFRNIVRVCGSTPHVGVANTYVAVLAPLRNYRGTGLKIDIEDRPGIH